MTDITLKYIRSLNFGNPLNLQNTEPEKLYEQSRYHINKVWF